MLRASPARVTLAGAAPWCSGSMPPACVLPRSVSPVRSIPFTLWTAEMQGCPTPQGVGEEELESTQPPPCWLPHRPFQAG